MKESDLRAFAARVRAARAYAGLSRDELAERTELTAASIKRVEAAGKVRLPVGEVARQVASATGVPALLLTEDWGTIFQRLAEDVQAHTDTTSRLLAEVQSCAFIASDVAARLERVGASAGRA